jgi:hypothetical protein
MTIETAGCCSWRTGDSVARLASRPPWTSTNCTGAASSDECSAMAKQKSPRGGPARSEVVPSRSRRCLRRDSRIHARSNCAREVLLYPARRAATWLPTAARRSYHEAPSGSRPRVRPSRAPDAGEPAAQPRRGGSRLAARGGGHRADGRLPPARRSRDEHSLLAPSAPGAHTAARWATMRASMTGTSARSTAVIG